MPERYGKERVMEKREMRKEALKLIEELNAGGRRSASTRVNLYARARKLSLSVPDASCGAKAVAEGLSKLRGKRLDAMSSRIGISRDELEKTYRVTTVELMAGEANKGNRILLSLLCQAICDGADIYAKSMDAERLIAAALEDALV